MKTPGGPTAARRRAYHVCESLAASRRAARRLSAPEASLLALLEVIFGILWAWWGANETPTREVLLGGALVIGALLGNELLGMGTATPRK